jgi:hypothetical protein
MNVTEHDPMNPPKWKSKSPITGLDLNVVPASWYFDLLRDFQLMRERAVRVIRSADGSHERLTVPWYAMNELSTVVEKKPLISVTGAMEITKERFIARCEHFIVEEQRKPLPDNALIGLFCDAIRLARAPEE